MFCLYILKSLKDKRTYVEHTADMEHRLLEHNSGRVPATKIDSLLEFLKLKFIAR